jgi:hypothetical protein
MPVTESTEKRDKLVSKVVKLFRLGDAARSNTTEGELLSAISKAKELMAVHNIAMVEVEGRLDETKVNELRIKIKEHSAYTRKGKFARYDHPIMRAVSVLTDTDIYLSNKGGYQSAMFVGEETDAHVAGELYTVLLPSLRRYTRQACGKGWSTNHSDYAMGFGTRVEERAKQQVQLNKQQQHSMALVRTRKKDALSQFMNRLQLTPAHKRRRQTYNEHYNKGYTDGTRMNFGHKHTIKGD